MYPGVYGNTGGDDDEESIEKEMEQLDLHEHSDKPQEVKTDSIEVKDKNT
jgi:hypothetical protein